MDLELRTAALLRARPIIPVVGFAIEHLRKGRLLSRSRGLMDICGTVGRDWLCQMVAGSNFATQRGSYLRYCAIGSGTVTPSGTQQALIAQIYRGTVAFSKDTAVGSCSLDRSFSIGSTYAMKESALFLQAAGGTMYCRGTYPIKNVSSGDTINAYYSVGYL